MVKIIKLNFDISDIIEKELPGKPYKLGSGRQKVLKWEDDKGGCIVTRKNFKFLDITHIHYDFSKGGCSFHIQKRGIVETTEIYGEPQTVLEGRIFKYILEKLQES